MRAILPLVIAAAGLAGPGAALAQDVPPAVKARQAHMSLYAHNIGILGGMARGNIDYDAAAASAAASNLAALAALDQSTYWPPGTDSDTLMESRALPAIWENLPDVIEKAGALRGATEALAATAGDGLDAVRAGLGPVGQACGACHESYQLSDN